MAVAAITKPLDRWDLIADRELGVPELGWAIAEANPDLIGYLVLPAGITLNVPDLATLRRPLTAANPAREDDGEFLPLLPDDTPAPIPTSGGVVGDFVPLSAVGVTVAPLFNNLVPIGNLPAYPTLISLGGLASDRVGVTVAPLIDGIVPLANLPAFPSLADLGGVSTTTYTAGINSRIATSARSAANGVAPLGGDSVVPSSFLPAYPTLSSLGGLASSTRNAAGGVAGLDVNSLLSIGQIPIAAQFQHLIRSSGTAFDFNVLNVGSAAIKWIDNNAGNTNGAVFGTNGTLLQYDPFFGIAGLTNLYKLQTLANHTTPRIADRQQINGAWGTWFERAYLNKAQSFLNLQDFAAAATFKGGTVPSPNTSLIQAGTDAAGLPCLWLVNSAATVNNRIKCITILTSGNFEVAHYNDDGTKGNTLTHTASGNILTNGTVRPGSGASAFTGAQFVPGSTYFRTDYPSGTGTGVLTHSNGTDWIANMTRFLVHGSVSPDNYESGMRSADLNIDGTLRGWHVITSMRPSDATLGVQIAFCDTSPLIRYRRKAGTWASWLTIAVT